MNFELIPSEEAKTSATKIYEHVIRNQLITKS